MVRRAALVLALVAIAATPAGADTIVDQKDSVDAKIAALGDRVEKMRQREAAARAELASVSREIRVLADRVGDISAQLEPLERDLELRQARLRRLDSLFRLQTKRLALLRRQHAVAVDRLSGRLVDLYEQPDTDTISLLLSSASFWTSSTRSTISSE